MCAPHQPTVIRKQKNEVFRPLKTNTHLFAPLSTPAGALGKYSRRRSLRHRPAAAPLRYGDKRCYDQGNYGGAVESCGGSNVESGYSSHSACDAVTAAGWDNDARVLLLHLFHIRGSRGDSAWTMTGFASQRKEPKNYTYDRLDDYSSKRSLM